MSDLSAVQPAVNSPAPLRARHIPYCFQTSIRVARSIPQSVFAEAYESAAAWLEANSGYDASTAILKATDHLPERTARLAALAFLETFGQWIGSDEGVFMLCFAASFARTDRLQ